MPTYQVRGEVPRKRHVQFRDNGRLLTEEVMGLEGFDGNESILYHLTSPCRVTKVADFEPIKREEWVPDGHAHRHFRTMDIEPGGDVLYKEGDYVVVPRGTTYRFRPEGDQRYVVFESPGLIEIPRRYRNEYGQLLEHAPFYHRDIHPPTDLRTHRDGGEFKVKVRVRDGYQTYVLDYHPFDVVGWDGFVYPWTFSIHDFEPITGRIPMPPPSHQTFQGRNFVICSFCPRKLDFDPLAIPIPYHHSNLNSEEMIYYVSGNFSSRRGIDVGSVTLHPSGIPHGPHPRLAKKLDDGQYAYSWLDEGTPAAESADEDPAGVTSHF